MSVDRRRVAVLVVGYNNADDINSCLASLGESLPEPGFDVFICENGGATAFEALSASLMAPESQMTVAADAAALAMGDRLAESRCFSFNRRQSKVWIARAIHNLGYAGAINSLVESLPSVGAWRGVWILNPDTRVDARALAELMDRASATDIGMVGSSIVDITQPDRLFCRGGLRQELWTGRGVCIGWGSKLTDSVDVASIERSMQSVSGASMFVTWDALTRIGPMDERFFLYMEDLDWGERARRLGVKLGYAPRSLVFHEGGSTIGRSSSTGSGRSWLSVYLMSRNRVTFVHKLYPAFLLYTAAISLLHALRYLLAGSWRDMLTALQGIYAGLKGEIGPPPRMVREGRAVGRPPNPKTRLRLVKVAISGVYFLAMAVWGRACGLFGRERKPQLSILYYHAVHADFAFEFNRQMDLIARDCHVVRADHVGPLPAGKKTVAITFDDALTSVMKNAAPILQRHSFPSTIFVPAGLMGRAPNWESDDPSYNFEDAIMSPSQLRSLPRELVTIGSHTLTHANLALVDRATAQREIDGSRTELARVMGYDVDLFSAPYGGLNEDAIALSQASGYRFIYGILPDDCDTMAASLLRGRIRVDPWDGPLEFYLKVHGAYAWFGKLRALRARLGR